MSKVKNKYLADIASQTIKGRATAGTGNVEDLSATQATAILNQFVGDSGSGGTKGLVPAPAAGDAAANKFMNADGTFKTVVASPSPQSPAWVKITLSHAAFQTAATTNTIDLIAALPQLSVIHQVLIKHSTAFAGTSITGYTLSVGVIGTLTKYTQPFDAFQSVADANKALTHVDDIPSFTGGTTAIKITATSTGANLSASTAGSVDVWVQTSLLN